MMIFKEKLALIIPTKDRPEELSRLLQNISMQDPKPVQIVVVDGGVASLEDVLKKFLDLNIEYVMVKPPSLTTQRNVGIKKICGEATLVAFLDDDVVLEKTALTNMMRFWEAASKDTGGASFNLINEIYKKPSFIEKMFLVNAETPSRILRSGFQSKVAFRKETMACEWLPGCAMVWRKNVFNEFTFDEWFSGYARYEEVDFSYRVGRKYKLFIVGDARVEHLRRLESMDFSSSLGRMEIVNRLYLAKKHPALSLLLCCWGCFGLFLNNMIKGLFYSDRRYILRSRGNIRGFIEALSKRSSSHKG